MKTLFQKYSFKNFISFISLLFFLSLFLSGCSKEKIIKENTFVKIYADLVIAQDSLAADSLGFTNEQKAIFARYDVKKKLYIKTLTHYKKNPVNWKSFFKKVTAYLREKEKEKP